MNYYQTKILYSTNLSFNFHDAKIYLLSNNSGYYVFLRDSSSYLNIWKYVFSLPSTAECKRVSELNGYYPSSVLMLSDNEFFFLHNPTPYNLLYFARINLKSGSTSWVDKMSWTLSYCYSDSIESVISSDKSSIYFLFTYGTDITKYLYYVCFNSLDGSILSSRYKSSIKIYDVYSIVLYGDYVISSTDYPYLVMYSITTFSFTIKRSYGDLYSMILDSGSGR